MQRGRGRYQPERCSNASRHELVCPGAPASPLNPSPSALPPLAGTRGGQGLLRSSRSHGQSSDVTHETLLVGVTGTGTRQRGSPTSPPPSPVLPGAGKRASPDTQGWSPLQAVPGDAAQWDADDKQSKRGSKPRTKPRQLVRLTRPAGTCPGLRAPIPDTDTAPGGTQTAPRQRAQLLAAPTIPVPCPRHRHRQGTRSIGVGAQHQLGTRDMVSLGDRGTASLSGRDSASLGDGTASLRDGRAPRSLGPGGRARRHRQLRRRTCRGTSLCPASSQGAAQRGEDGGGSALVAQHRQSPQITLITIIIYNKNRMQPRQRAQRALP